MTLVVDASVAAKWFIEETGRAQAIRLLDFSDRQAPDLLLAEVANVVWKKALRGQITAHQARFVCASIAGYFDAIHPSETLIEDAIRMAVLLRHPIYDCLYLACAARAGAYLVTADRRLLAAIESTELESLAVHVDAFVR